MIWLRCCNICPPFLFHVEHCLSFSLVMGQMFAFHYLFAIFYHFMVVSFFRPLWVKHHLKQIFSTISISSFWYFLLVLEVRDDPHNCLKLLLVRMSQDGDYLLCCLVFFLFWKWLESCHVYLFLYDYLFKQKHSMYMVWHSLACFLIMYRPSWSWATYAINAYDH